MKKLLLLPLVLIAVLFFLIYPYFQFVTNKLGISTLKTIFPGKTLNKTNDQVNILILGIAGGNHDGPNLSDSIIVANYNFKTNKLTTFGLPRDVWSDALNDRINSAYAYGIAKGDNKTGIKLAKAAVENVINHPVHYAVVIDFDRFKGLIDHVGGVDVVVERSFIDHEFPIAGKENDNCGGDEKFKCRYESISFQKGFQHMNGDQALKFVRSRHAEGDEGSDFARSQRQQLVLTALKDKMMSIFLSRDMDKINALYDTIDKSISRDMTNQQLAILTTRIYLKKKFTQKNLFLPEDLFEIPDGNDYEGKYVLIPKDNDSDLIKNYLTCIINDQTNCKVI